MATRKLQVALGEMRINTETTVLKAQNANKKRQLFTIQQLLSSNMMLSKVVSCLFSLRGSVNLAPQKGTRKSNVHQKFQEPLHINNMFTTELTGIEYIIHAVHDQHTTTQPPHNV